MESSQFVKIDELYLVVSGFPYEDQQNIEKICSSKQAAEIFIQSFLKEDTFCIWHLNTKNYYLEWERDDGKYLVMYPCEVENLWTKES